MMDDGMRVRVEHDELAELRSSLEDIQLGQRSLFGWLSLACKESNQRPSDPHSLMDALRSAGIQDDIQTAYWHLVVEGVLKFTNIVRWWEDAEEPTMETSLRFVTLARRGAALLQALSEDRAR
jgi:hypothetical protein